MRVKSIILFLFILATSLLHVSLGQLLQISFSRSDPNKVTLECRGRFTTEPATFTLRDTMDNEKNFTTTRGKETLTITVLPENETIVSCTIDGRSESERVAITAIPRYPNASAIRQFVFSDSSTAELECPLNLGRLHGLFPSYYDFSWRVRKDTRTSMVTPNINEAYQLSNNNRLLQVQLPLSLPPTHDISFQCNGQIRRCNSSSPLIPNICNQPKNAPGPWIELKFVDPANITIPPSDANVIQGQEASFSCAASGDDDLSIVWLVDGFIYDSERCSGGSHNCSISEDDSRDSNGWKTSTLTIKTRNMDSVKNVTMFTIVCAVNQMLNVGPSEGHEIRRPPVTNRNQSSNPVQLRISPAPPTIPPPTGATSTGGNMPSAGPGSSENIYIITAIVNLFIVILIIILSSCIVYIFHYHYKNKERHLGRMLRQQDPSAHGLKYTRREPSPRQIEDQHFHGADILYTDTSRHLGHDSHQLDCGSQNPVVSFVSSLSGVSRNRGSHKISHHQERSMAYPTPHATTDTEPNHRLTSVTATGTNLVCVTQSESQAITMQDHLSTTDTSSTIYSTIVPCPIVANLPGAKLETLV